MANKIVINSPLGNPYNYKTWTGVAYNFIEEFKKQGIDVKGFNSQIDRKYTKIFKFYSLLNGYGRDYSKLVFARKLRYKKLLKQIDKNKRVPILHMGDMGLPYIAKNDNLDHYLYTDYNWNLWKKYNLKIFKHKDKYIQEIEQNEKEVFSFVKHIFTMSEYVRRDIIDNYGINERKASTVNTGLGKIKPYFGEKNYSRKNILFVTKNRFNEKGGDLIVNAMKILANIDSDIHLTIVGGERDKEIIGEHKNIKLTGFLSWDELQNEFNNASLFVMPALNEPWGIVYTEALACKTPVLGLNRNALPEITDKGKYGFLIEEENPEDIARTIINALSKPLKLNQMGIDGQKYVLKNFSWEIAVKKIKEILFKNSG